LDEGIANNPDIPDIKFEKAGKTTIDQELYRSRRRAEEAIAGKDGHEKGLKGSDDYPYAAR